MANEKKISGLTDATEASASDEFVVVNKNVTTGQDASVSGQTSKITLENLRNSILGGSGGSTAGDVVFDGNVGIGGIPVDHPSITSALQLGERAHISATDNGHLNMVQNAYQNADNDKHLRYVHGRSARYRQYDGEHIFSHTTENGPGGEASKDSEIEWKESMHIKSNGNVGINGQVGINDHSTPPTGAYLTVKNGGQHGATGVHIWNNSDALAGDEGMIGAYTAWGTKNDDDAAGPDYSYNMGIDMTEARASDTVYPKLKIGFALKQWATPADSNKLVTITGEGMVGVGTESPGGRLHLGMGDANLVFNYASNMFDTTTAGAVGITYTDRLHIGSVFNDAPIITMTLKKEGGVVVAGNVSTSGFDENDLDNVRATDASGLDNINNLVVSDFEKDGVTKTGIVAQNMQKVLPQSVSDGEEYEAVVASAKGRVVKGLGTDEEHEFCPSLTKSDFSDPKHMWVDGAEFIETEAEETEMRTSPLATSNDELIATLVKAVQELSAKNDELNAKVESLGHA